MRLTTAPDKPVTVTSDKNYTIKHLPAKLNSFTPIGRLNMKDTANSDYDLIELLGTVKPTTYQFFMRLKKVTDYRTGYAKFPPTERGMSASRSSEAMAELEAIDLVRRTGKRNMFQINPDIIQFLGIEDRISREQLRLEYAALKEDK